MVPQALPGATAHWGVHAGAGYRAEVKGKSLHLTLGYSHPIKYDLPEGVKAQVTGSVKWVGSIQRTWTLVDAKPKWKHGRFPSAR